MPRCFTVAILSDVHYAGPIEQARGDEFEFSRIHNPFIRWFARTLRNFAWLNHPTRHNGQLTRFLEAVGEPDCVVANGDLGCDTASLGLADNGTRESANECAAILRARFDSRLRFTIGDHELGKLSLWGDRGGMSLESWHRCVADLALESCWKLELGNYVLLGVAAPLIALPACAREILPAEQNAWEKLRVSHIAEIRAHFGALKPQQRVLLFCHDPTALSELWSEPGVRAKLGQIEHTIVGHLHSPLVLWKSRLLAGLPVIRFLGGNVERMTVALNEASKWKDFKVRLCPALAGIQLLNDGGFLTVELDAEARLPAQFKFHPLPR